MVDPVTSSESASIIAAVTGGAGIGGVIIAVLGYLTAQRSGRRGETEKTAGAVGISALLADSDSVSKLSVALQSVALAADKIALLTIENRQDIKDLANDFIDEVRKLRRAVEDANSSR